MHSLRWNFGNLTLMWVRAKTAALQLVLINLSRLFAEISSFRKNTNSSKGSKDDISINAFKTTDDNVSDWLSSGVSVMKEGKFPVDFMYFKARKC